jgi:hypothetical protein
MMYNDDSSNVQTHAVKTKIVTVQHTVTEFWLENMSIDKKQIFEDLIKEKLANEMARTLLKENLVLFTKESHPDKFDTIYRARCYLADKQDVALIANIK